jgi:SAM-dependent methyltransferase
MTLEIDLFWSFRSPYSYLATPRLVELEAKHDLTIHVRPVLPIAVRIDGFFDRVFCLSVIEHVPRELWPACMKEMARVLKPGGRLVMTMDMETGEADARLYMRLVEACPLALQGDPHYPAPIDRDEAQRRHPGNWYETLGMVWTK